MLELDEFITEATTSIVRGILKGQESDVGEYIAPLLKGDERKGFGVFHLKNDKSNQATIVEFDISVSATSSTTQKGGASAKAKLYVVDIGISGDKGREKQASSLHKLKFNIPIKIPKRTDNTAPNEN